MYVCMYVSMLHICTQTDRQTDRHTAVSIEPTCGCVFTHLSVCVHIYIYTLYMCIDLFVERVESTCISMYGASGVTCMWQDEDLKDG